MPINTICVIKAPLLILSDNQPPKGRDSAPTKGPKNAYFTGSISGNWLFVSKGKPAAKPINEPNVPKYRIHIIQLCLRRKIIACSLKLALALAKSFMPNQAASVDNRIKGTQIKPAFCSHICLLTSPFTQVCASPPNAPNTPAVITKGTINCTTDTPKLPKPAFKPKAVPFSALG